MQRSQGEGLLLAVSAPTAKTLRARAVWVEPHWGHGTFSASLMLRTSLSKLLRHFLQVYS